MIAVHKTGDIDIHSHGVIEASAGTGKTYTLENLYIHLIKNGADLEKILVVTFTEKATGELRHRIRSCIEKELKDEALPLSEKRVLATSLNNFENAQIFTIHGFCQRILREYAFENGRQFTLDLVDDEPVYRMMLRAIMRDAWPVRFGENLAHVLRFSGYGDAIYFDRNQWEEAVLSVAQQWKPEVNERLFPDPAPLTLHDLDRHGRSLCKILAKIKRIVGPVDPGARDENEFYKGYGGLNFMKSSVQKNQRDVLLPLLDLLVDVDHFLSSEKNGLNAVHVLAAVKNFFNSSKKLEAFSEDAYAYLRPKKWNKNYDNSSLVCPGLDHLIAGLNDLRVQFGPAPHHQLAVNTIKELKHDVGIYKDDQGLFSYDDMLVLLNQSLDSDVNPGAEGFCSALRRRYDVALVDEFQDTDLIQWGIFKTIFVDDSDQTGKRLFIIGDPKQAIYGFRGADVHAYFLARDYLTGPARAKEYILEVNWRSVPALLEPLNALFGSSTWFQEGGGIGYKDVCSPKREEQITRLYQDDTKTPAVVFVEDELKSPPTPGRSEPKNAQRKMAGYISGEVKRLLTPGSGLKFSIDDDTRQLNPGDICVLVRKASEARAVEIELDKFEIPHTFYKKQGLYQSDEVMHLNFLIKAIADPSNQSTVKKALLTRFFNISIQALWRYEDLLPDHPARRLFQTWQEYGRHRQWPKLFDSIVKDTGILYRDAGEIDADRRITNFEQVIQYLEMQIDSRNLDITGLSEHLDMLRTRSIRIDRDADLYRLETDAPTVQIMTIHAAKGMEFPVVFLAGGFTAVNASSLFLKVHDRQNQAVYDLTAKKYKSAWQKEQQEEEKRLYYVALTRAMCKLYVPLFFPSGRRQKPSPVSGFIHDSILTLPAVVRDMKSALYPDAPETSSAEAAQGEESVFHDLSPKDILPPDQIHFQQYRIDVDSFSGLMRRFHPQEKEQPAVWLPPSGGRAYDVDHPLDHDDDGDENETITFEPEDEIDGCRPLPGGKVTGNLMHRILESIDFQQARAAASYRDILKSDSGIDPVVDEWMAYYEISDTHENLRQGKPTYKNEICRWIWNVLHVPLIPDRLKLCELSLADRLNEQEFYYPYPAPKQKPMRSAGASRHFQKTGFLNGSIDLVFRNKNRLYLLDWKTNYLADGYGKDAVQRAVEQKYRLQLEIYSIAIRRWLGQLSGEMAFGGVYYLFLRGIDPLRPGEGIFFHQPSAGEIDGYEQKLAALLQGHGGEDH